MFALAVDTVEPPPLMEGEGKSFKVLGFSQSQRATFVQILMRFVCSPKLTVLLVTLSILVINL